MNEVDLMEDILQIALDIAQRYHARRIRVINLALYDERVDCSPLARHLEILARGTIAASVRLNWDHPVRERRRVPRTSTFVEKRLDAFSIDSIELE